MSLEGGIVEGSKVETGRNGWPGSGGYSFRACFSVLLFWSCFFLHIWIFQNEIQENYLKNLELDWSISSPETHRWFATECVSLDGAAGGGMASVISSHPGQEDREHEQQRHQQQQRQQRQAEQGVMWSVLDHTMKGSLMLLFSMNSKISKGLFVWKYLGKYRMKSDFDLFWLILLLIWMFCVGYFFYDFLTLHFYSYFISFFFPVTFLTSHASKAFRPTKLFFFHLLFA